MRAMKILKHFSYGIVFFFSLIAPSSIIACPANPYPQSLNQPSGEEFISTLHGDEWFNWRTLDNGCVILLGPDGYWQYVVLEGKELVLTGDRVGIDPRPNNTLPESGLIEWRQEQLAAAGDSIIPFPQAAPSSTSSLLTTSLPAETAAMGNLNSRTLCILVEFNDVTLTYSEQAWADFIFTDGGTLKGYFNEISAGKFYFTPASEAYGTVDDGLIRVSLPYPHPDTASQITRDNQQIVKDALIAADQYVDFASFDTDRNGSISGSELHIVTVVAGYDACYGSGFPSIWAHWWYLTGKTIAKLDGVVLGDADYGGSYVQIGEIQGDHMATIGIPAHELGHELGLPDLYDYDGSSLGVGVHSLMGTGCWGYVTGQFLGSSPTHLDPWSRIRLNFIDVQTDVTTQDIWLAAALNDQDTVIKVPTIDPNQYFLLENRQFIGFDQGLSNVCRNGGVAIWHVDETVIAQKETSGINNDENHKGIDLEEANQGLIGYSQLDNNEYQNYDHYYYQENSSLFAQETLPSSDLYDGTDTGLAIDVEDASSELMLAALSVSIQDILPPLVVNTIPLDNVANVELDSAISIFFNEEVLPADTWEDISLVSAVGPLSISVTLTGRILTIIPVGDLTKNTSYNVIIPVGAVADLSGNLLQEAFDFSFTTSRH